MEAILNIQWQIRLENVDVWFQDEARFGQQNTTTRVWARKGTRPRVVQQVSKATPKGRHAVVAMDGAGWHTQELADELDNLSLIKIPPYSPELNPIEQVWQWLRQNELANRCFKGYDDIVNSCSDAWSNFVACRERVKKLCSREWINLIS